MTILSGPKFPNRFGPQPAKFVLVANSSPVWCIETLLERDIFQYTQSLLIRLLEHDWNREEYCENDQGEVHGQA